MKKIFVLLMGFMISFALLGCDSIYEVFKTEYISSNSAVKKNTTKEKKNKDSTTSLVTYNITTESVSYEKKSRSTTLTFIPKTSYTTTSKEKLVYTTEESTCDHNEVEFDKYIYPQFSYYGYNGGTYCNKCGATLSVDYIEPYGTILFSKYIYLIENEENTEEVEYTLIIDDKDAICSLYDDEGSINDDVTYGFTLIRLTKSSESGYVLEYDTGTLKWHNDGIYALSYTDKTKSNDFMVFFEGEFMFTDINGSANSYKHAIRERIDRDYIPRSGNTDYGYYFLNNYENSSDLKALYYDYYRYAEGLYNSTDDLTKINDLNVITYINTSKYNLSYGEICGVWNLFCNCSPAYYFLSNEISVVNNTISCFMLYEYYLSYDNRIDYINKLKLFEDNFDSYKTTNEIGNTETELVKAIHDYICNSIEYAWSDKKNKIAETQVWAHNMTGAILYSTGVCECYSKTFLYLCMKNDIDAIVICGIAENEGHSWNAVCINGNWYGVDVTWDDQEKGIIYKYLCADSETMNNNRTADDYHTFSISYQYMIPDFSETGITW